MKSTISIFIVAVVFASCSNSSSKTTENPYIEPGSTSRPIGSLIYEPGLSTGTEDSIEDIRPLTLCNLAIPGQTIAIIEGVENPTDIPLGEDCSGPYASDGYQASVHVLAVVAGQALPQNLTIVSLTNPEYHGLPKPGETWLISIRQLRGEWFLFQSVAVNIMATKTESSDESSGQFPSDFMELVSECNNTITNYTSECPNFSAITGVTDEQWAAHQFEPPPWLCPSGNEEPDAGEQ